MKMDDLKRVLKLHLVGFEIPITSKHHFSILSPRKVRKQFSMLLVFSVLTENTRSYMYCNPKHTFQIVEH